MLLQRTIKLPALNFPRIFPDIFFPILKGSLLTTYIKPQATGVHSMKKEPKYVMECPLKDQYHHILKCPYKIPCGKR